MDNPQDVAQEIAAGLGAKLGPIQLFVQDGKIRLKAGTDDGQPATLSAAEAQGLANALQVMAAQNGK